MIFNSFEPTSPILIQGMTGSEGRRMAGWLIESGAHVVAGVTPGKGGQEIDGRPIFNSVAEARTAFPALEISSIVVPAAHVLSAVREAVEAGMRVVHILTEGVPVHDVRAIKRIAEGRAVVLGPSSVGYLQFPVFRVGYIGGKDPFATLKEGGVFIASTSGGMTNELMMACARHAIGIRAAIAIGGDYLPGFSLEEAVHFADMEPSVTVITAFAEPGHTFLTRLAKGDYRPMKPLILFLAGDILDRLPRGVAYGHTGTILGENDLSVAELRHKLQERGIICVKTMGEFIKSPSLRRRG